MVGATYTCGAFSVRSMRSGFQRIFSQTCKSFILIFLRFGIGVGVSASTSTGTPASPVGFGGAYLSEKTPVGEMKREPPCAVPATRCAPLSRRSLPWAAARP